jgi:hypothetical protein
MLDEKMSCCHDVHDEYLRREIADATIERNTVATKNSISSNSGLATGFLKTLAVPIRQNGAGFILGIASGHQRCRRRSVEVFPRAAIGAGGWDWPVGVSGHLPFVPVMKPADLRDRHDATID